MDDRILDKIDEISKTQAVHGEILKRVENKQDYTNGKVIQLRKDVDDLMPRKEVKKEVYEVKKQQTNLAESFQKFIIALVAIAAGVITLVETIFK